jgi:hypothetical protein
MSIKLNSLADIQHELLTPVQWAMNSTYHATLQATSAQLAFHHNMIMPTSYMAHWQSICQRRQAITDRDNVHKNARRVPHTYSVGDLVLIHQDTHGKLAKPTRGPYRLIDVACQHVNGTVVVDLNHSHETFNIQQLIKVNAAVLTVIVLTMKSKGNNNKPVLKVVTTKTLQPPKRYHSADVCLPAITWPHHNSFGPRKLFVYS